MQQVIFLIFIFYFNKIKKINVFLALISEEEFARYSSTIIEFIHPASELFIPHAEWMLCPIFDGILLYLKNMDDWTKIIVSNSEKHYKKCVL